MAISARARELGAFLRDKRTRLVPAAIGFAGGAGRRIAGLRRDEVAVLADLSPGYYTRMEQGRAPNPSASVLSALARALRLTPDERAYLFALAECADPEVEVEDAAPEGHKLLDLLAETTPAYVINRLSDVLAWNPVAAALFPHLVAGGGRLPNNTRFVFTDPAARRLFARWASVAADSAAHLRATAGPRPDDPGLCAMIGELLAVSPDFAPVWAQRHVRRNNLGRKELNHPGVGRLVLDYQVLDVPTAPGQRLVLYSAEAGTRSHEALRELAASQELAEKVS